MLYVGLFGRIWCILRVLTAPPRCLAEPSLLMSVDATDTPLPRHSRLFGMPRSALFEVLGFYGLALVLDLVVLDGNRYAGWEPHPFFVFTLIIAAHYGTSAGVFSTIVGTFVAFVGNLPPRDPLQDQSVYLLAIIGKPMVWFACAVLLGELRTRRVRIIEALHTHNQEMETKNKALVFANSALELSNERLHARAAGQVETTVSLVEAAKALKTRESGSVFASVEGLVQNLLSPSAYSIYLKTERGLELVMHTTDGNSPQALDQYGQESPLFQAVVDRLEIVHVASPHGHAVLAGDGVIAGPLLDAEAGQALGMLKLEGLPLAKVRQETIHVFGLLCEWIGNAYHEAKKFEAANDSQIFRNGSQLFTHAYYQPVSAFIVAVAERARFDITQLTLRMQPEPGTPLDDASALARVVQQAVESGLRTTDLAFDYAKDRGEFVVLLPMTPVKYGQRVADRLRNSVERHLGAQAERVKIYVTFESLYVPAPEDLKPWHRAVIRRTDPYLQ